MWNIKAQPSINVYKSRGGYICIEQGVDGEVSNKHSVVAIHPQAFAEVMERLQTVAKQLLKPACIAIKTFTAEERTAGSKWKDSFESGRPSKSDIESGMEYQFGPSATEEQLAQVEQKMGVALPGDLRDLLREFNGITCTSKYDRKEGHKPTPQFLSTNEIPGVIDILGQSGNDIPTKRQLKKVVFFWQTNGYADIYGLCLAKVGKSPAGTVVLLDHECGVLEPRYPNLLTFIHSHGKSD